MAGKAVEFAKKIPVIGNVIDTVDTVASSILSFLGGGSNLFEVHYLQDGTSTVRLHKRILSQNAGDYKTALGYDYLESANVAPGDILMRYEISIGPEGSRSRTMGQLYEKVIYRGFQLAVNANCSATTSGSIAYVFVPDPSDRSLELLSGPARLAAVCARENVQFAQLFQSTLLTFNLPAREFFVNIADGVERLASPGAVYAIAMTDLDPTFLPTLRQTSMLKFTRPTNGPQPSPFEEGVLDSGAKITVNGSIVDVEFHMMSLTGTSGHDFSADRIKQVNYVTTTEQNEQTFNFYVKSVVQVKRGEVFRATLPWQYDAGTWMPLGHIDGPAYLNANSNSKPGSPFSGIWNGMPVIYDGTAPGAVISNGCSQKIYELNATEDIEVILPGDFLVSAGSLASLGRIDIRISKTASAPIDMIPTEVALKRVIKVGTNHRFMLLRTASVEPPRQRSRKVSQKEPTEQKAELFRPQSAQPAVSLRR